MKILVVNPFGIGDVLFTTPLLRALAEKGYEVYYWSNERVSDIIRHNPSVRGVFSLARGDIKKILKRSPLSGIRRLSALFKWIKKHGFNIAFDFSLDYRYSLILWILGVKKRIGFDYKKRGRFLTDAVKIDGFAEKHVVEHYNNLLRFISPSLNSKSGLELYVGEDDSEKAGIFLQKHGILPQEKIFGIAPGGGGSWGRDAFRKRWPKEKFAYVAEKLGSEADAKVVIFGSEDESDICAYIAKAADTFSVNACGKLTLGEYAAVLRRCKLLITNDGGPLHMAVALGVPTVSVFGPVDKNVYGPYPASPEHIVMSGRVECGPCYRNFRYPSCRALICLDSIKPDEVLRAAKRLLDLT